MKRELQKLSAIASSFEKEGNVVAGRIITEAMSRIASWQDIADDTIAEEENSQVMETEGDPSIPYGTHDYWTPERVPQWVDITDLVGMIDPDSDLRETVEEEIYQVSKGSVELLDIKEADGRVYAKFSAAVHTELNPPERDYPDPDYEIDRRRELSM